MSQTRSTHDALLTRRFGLDALRKLEDSKRLQCIIVMDSITFHQQPRVFEADARFVGDE